ncbi:MAG TPA: hypothetical protein VK732_08645 [Verrucomicrobiae bacterium]|nr:hypothetical protein [Verrucomicrobiae bacterium]
MTPSALPLPLELAQPIPLSGDLDTMFRAGLHIGGYDPKTQMSFGASACDTSSDSSAESDTSDNTGLIVIDAQTDFAVADDALQDIDNGGGFSDTSSESSAESNTTDNTGLIVIDSQTDAAVLDDFLQDFGNA